MSERKGTLFVCATPIGNLKDITLRALEVLQRVDLIAAEDTRLTLKLLNHFGIKKRLISYHKHSPPKRMKWLLQQLKEGKSIALVSGSGTPAVSDPGAQLVRAALSESISVVPLPGPSAVTTAFSVSGIEAHQFLFLGFPPHETKERRALLDQVKALPFPLVIYEAPHRLRVTLKDLLDILGNRAMVLCRELTKVHEEITPSTLSALCQRFQSEEPCGEFTLIIEGFTVSRRERCIQEAESLESLLSTLLMEGKSVRDAAKEAARILGVTRSQAYKKALELKRK